MAYTHFDATYLLRVEGKLLLVRPKGNKPYRLNLPFQLNITVTERDETLRHLRLVYAMTVTPASETERPHLVFFAECDTPLPADHALCVRGVRASVPALKALLNSTDALPTFEGFRPVETPQSMFNEQDIHLLEQVVENLRKFNNTKTIGDWMYDGQGIVVKRKKALARSEEA